MSILDFNLKFACISGVGKPVADILPRSTSPTSMSITAQGRSTWKEPKTAHVSTGYEKTAYEYSPWGLVLRCVTRDDIPCTMEEKKARDAGKSYFVNLTVLRVCNIGHGMAPFKKMPKGKPPAILQSKSLLEEVPGTHVVNPLSGQKTVVAARLYNFHKAMSPFDRGDRMDDRWAVKSSCVCLLCVFFDVLLCCRSSSIVYVGETLRFGMSEYLYEPGKKAFPAGLSVIPHGTIVEVVVTPSSSGDNLDKGYGLKLTHVHVHESTLQSYNVADSLGCFPSTFDDGRAFAAKCLEVGAPIRMNVDSGSMTVFSHVSKSSFVMDVCPETEFVRFSSDEGDIIPGIREADVHPEDLMR